MPASLNHMSVSPPHDRLHGVQHHAAHHACMHAWGCQVLPLKMGRRCMEHTVPKINGSEKKREKKGKTRFRHARI